MDVIKVRPNQTVTQPLDAPAVFELELPFWPPSPECTHGEAKPAKAKEFLAIRQLDEASKILPAVRQGQPKPVVGVQLTLTGGIAGSWHEIVVDDFHKFYLKILAPVTKSE